MKSPNQNDSFRNSDLNRAKPKKNTFGSLFESKLKRHRSDTGLVEDRMKNTTVVRIIVALLLVHMLIIGGVLVRDDLVRTVKTDAVSPSLTQPPAPQSVIPQPTQPTMATAASSKPEQAPVEPIVVAPVQPTVTSTATATPQTPTITTAQPQEAVAVDPEVKPQVTPVVAVPAPAAAVPTVRPQQDTPVKHYVQSGDTWTRIVATYGISSEALQKANPNVKPELLVSGTYLLIPDKNGNVPAEATAKDDKPAPGSVYTVKAGDTMARIAKKHGISLPKLLKYNNMTMKEAGRIRIGQEIRLSE